MSEPQNVSDAGNSVSPASPLPVQSLSYASPTDSAAWRTVVKCLALSFIVSAGAGIIHSTGDVVWRSRVPLLANANPMGLAQSGIGILASALELAAGICLLTRKPAARLLLYIAAGLGLLSHVVFGFESARSLLRVPFVLQGFVGWAGWLAMATASFVSALAFWGMILFLLTRPGAKSVLSHHVEI